MSGADASHGGRAVAPNFHPRGFVEPIESARGNTKRIFVIRTMDHENTIPSQLGPINTIPAALGSGTPSATLGKESTGLGGLIFKLLLLAVTVGLALYFAR